VAATRVRSGQSPILKLSWAISLSLLLVFWRPALGGIGAAAATYRLIDIVVYLLSIALLTRRYGLWRPETATRSLILAFVNVYEVVAAYELLYLGVGTLLDASTRTPITSPFTVFYYSMVTMATLGFGDVIPADTISRALVVSQLFTHLVFLLTIVPVFVAHLVQPSKNTE
jgi:hypothetical protein